MEEGESGKAAPAEGIFERQVPHKVISCNVENPARWLFPLTKHKTGTDCGKLTQSHTASWKQSQQDLGRPESKVLFPPLLAGGRWRATNIVLLSRSRVPGGAKVEPAWGGA